MSVVGSVDLHRRTALTSSRQRRRLAKIVSSPSKSLATTTKSMASLLGGPRDLPPPIVVSSMAADDAAVALTLRLAMDLTSRSRGSGPAHGRSFRRRPDGQPSPAPLA